MGIDKTEWQTGWMSGQPLAAGMDKFCLHLRTVLFVSPTQKVIIPFLLYMYPSYLHE